MKALKSLLFFLMIGPMALMAQENYNDFIPVGPAPIDFKVWGGQLFSEMYVDEKNNEEVINLLPNELTHKSIIEIDRDGAVKFSAIELSQKKYTYIVKTDYVKYTTLPVRKDSETGEVVGVARVGVGIRVVATLKTKKKDITVSDLHALGERAKEGDLSGHISVSIMGVESPEVTSGFQVNAEISPTSIAATLQDVVLTKQAIYDKDSHITPQVLEIKYTDEYKGGVSNPMELSMPILLNNRGEACVVIR